MTLVGAENASRPTLVSGLAWPKGERTAGTAGVIRYGRKGIVAGSSLFDWVGRPVVLERAEQTAAPAGSESELKLRLLLVSPMPTSSWVDCLRVYEMIEAQPLGPTRVFTALIALDDETACGCWYLIDTSMDRRNAQR